MREEKNLKAGECTISQLKTQEMCNNILEQLEKALSLKEDGKKKEADAVIDTLSAEVEKIMTQFDESEI